MSGPADRLAALCREWPVRRSRRQGRDLLSFLEEEGRRRGWKVTRISGPAGDLLVLGEGKRLLYTDCRTPAYTLLPVIRYPGLPAASLMGWGLPFLLVGAVTLFVRMLFSLPLLFWLAAWACLWAVGFCLVPAFRNQNVTTGPALVWHLLKTLSPTGEWALAFGWRGRNLVKKTHPLGPDLTVGPCGLGQSLLVTLPEDRDLPQIPFPVIRQKGRAGLYAAAHTALGWGVEGVGSPKDGAHTALLAGAAEFLAALTCSQKEEPRGRIMYMCPPLLTGGRIWPGTKPFSTPWPRGNWSSICTATGKPSSSAAIRTPGRNVTPPPWNGTESNWSAAFRGAGPCITTWAT